MIQIKINVLSALQNVLHVVIKLLVLLVLIQMHMLIHKLDFVSAILIIILTSLVFVYNVTLHATNVQVQIIINAAHAGQMLLSKMIKHVFAMMVTLKIHLILPTV